MNRVSLPMLKRMLVQLDRRFFDYLIQGFFRLELDGSDYNDVPMTVIVQMMLADWMSHLGCLSDHQKVMILERRGVQINEWTEQLVLAIHQCTARPLYTITISDVHYVHSSEDETWLDLVRDREVSALNSPAVTHVTCDVLELFRTITARVDRNNGAKDAHAKDRRDRHVSETG